MNVDDKIYFRWAV